MQRVKGSWNFPARFKRVAEARQVAGEFLPAGPERPLCEADKVEPGLCWKPQDTESPEPWDICQGDLYTGSGTSPYISEWWAAIWELGIELGSSGGAASDFTADPSPWPMFLFFNSFFKNFFGVGMLQGRRTDMKDWEIKRTGVHDVKLPKNQFLKMYFKSTKQKWFSQIIH